MNPLQKMNLPDIHQVMMNLDRNFPGIEKLIGACAFIIGLFFIVSGIMKLYEAGTHQNNSPNAIRNAIVFMFLGACLTYLPSGLWTISDSIFGSGGGDIGKGSSYHPLDYDPPAGMDARVSEIMAVLFRFIGLVGIASYVRGIMILKSSMEGRGDASVSKGIIHLFAGAAALNLNDFIQILKGSAGM